MIIDILWHAYLKTDDSINAWRTIVRFSFETEKRQQFTKLKCGFRRILYIPRINIAGD